MDGLTHEERELINCRNSIIGLNNDNRDKLEGTSITKRKGTDPREYFRNTDIPQQEMDIDEQQRELKKYKALVKGPKVKEKEKDKGRQMTSISNELQRNIRKTINSEKGGLRTSEERGDLRKDKGEENLLPVHQIDPGSFLGVAFKETRSSRKNKKKKKRGKKKSKGYSDHSSGDESSSLSSSSESATTHLDVSESTSEDESPSDSSTTGSSEESDDSSDSEADSKRKPSSGRSKGKGGYKKLYKLKLIPPERYDGMANAQLFHRFMTQSIDYVWGNAPKDKYVSIVASFLKGKAYTFYTRKVSLNLKKWNLEKFFTELFNYCFPANFKVIQCRKLENC
ncbi:hypothetical protein NP233_g4114 [Leucocoprinus birnbaumii]|uniref:Uncharacterized protein n=1 Tax=Leucocoprinus birnbaumii TaxID=56174 RepID=A0AAD5VY10_9AGAR|nr:hypothetical protein NP233_g4114 [Leucocoprinus birnbaumii]